MNERLRPTPEAEERIRQFGEKKIFQFLDEVTRGSVKNLVDFLPVVPGFRRQSEAGIKQQKLALAKRLAGRNSWAARDFMALYWMWRAWAWEQLGDPDMVDHLLDDLDNVLRQQNHHEDESREALRAGTLTFLNALKQLSLENKCSREKIVRLFEFSPLALDDPCEQLVNSCKPELQIERDKALNDLPNRLGADETEIQSIKARLVGLSSDIKTAVTKAGLIEQASDAHTKALRSLSDIADGLRQTLAAVEDSAKRNTEALEGLETRSNAFADQIRSGNRRNEELAGKLTFTMQSLSEAIAELRSSVEALQHERADVSPVTVEALEIIGKEVRALSAKLLTLSQGPLSEDLDALKARLDALESAKQIDASTTSVSEPTSVTVTELRDTPIATVQALADAGKLVDALSASFQRVGLKKTAAVLLGEEVAAAILSGQVVTFKGALAHLIAKKCAETLSYRHAWNVSIPIGLTDGRSLSAALHSLSSNSSSTVPSFVVEGLNRSALDCTKDALLACAEDHGASDQMPIFCFASLVSGIASLQVEPEHLEMGPVFDLDYLDWRLFPDADVVCAGGSVTPNIMAPLRTKLTQGAADDIDEMLRVLRKYIPKRNPRIERSVASAYAALKSIRDVRANTSAMQSLAYGWIVPLWAALSLSKEDADSELDGGKCDALNPDPRLVAMLNQEPFGARQREGGE